MTNVEVQEELFSFPEIDQGHWFEVCEFVKRFGSSTSVALFDPRCEIFSLPHIEGIIGFKTIGKCAVVFGNPVCSSADLPTLIKEFTDYCHDRNLRIIYTAVTKTFTDWALNNGCHLAIEVGQELFLNPQKNFFNGPQGRKLRTKVRQAEKSRISVTEYTGFDYSLEKKMDALAQAWSGARQGPQIYLAHIDLFADRLGKRWFYATQEGEITGVVLLNQLENGWVLNLMMVTPEAVNGTSELLAYSIIESLKKEGVSYLSLGTFAREEIGDIQGLGPILRKILRTFYKVAIRLLRLEGRKHYWKKFQPHPLPCYLIFSEKKIGFAEIISLFKSLNTSF